VVLEKEDEMKSWTVGDAAELEFDRLTDVHVRMMGGLLSVTNRPGPPALRIHGVKGKPIRVEYDDGTLTALTDGVSLNRFRSRLIPSRLRSRADVALSVPPGCDFRAEVVNADVVFSHQGGHSTIRSVTGDVTISGASGEIRADTLCGRIDVAGAGGSLELHAVTGDLTVVPDELDRLDLHVVTGSVLMDIQQPLTGSGQVSSVTGEVTVRFAAEADVAFEAVTRGPLVSSLPDVPGSGSPTTKHVLGRIGAGRGSLRIDGGTGRVSLLGANDRPPVAENVTA
jgi:hypothetical protein